MKKILAPVDFSETSDSAMRYAAGMAVAIGAEVVLLHVCYTPTLLNEAVAVLPAPSELEGSYMKDLADLRDRILREYGESLVISCRVQFGFPAEEIILAAKQLGADVIVAGMPESGFMMEKLLGTVTTTLMVQAPCPVLAIHSGVKFTGLKRLVLATDDLEISDDALQPLKKLLAGSGTHLYLLSVVREPEAVLTEERAIAGFGLGRKLTAFGYSFHDIFHEDIVEGISGFVKRTAADMVVVVPRKHGFFSFFRESISKKAAFHLHTPLLVLKDPAE